MTKNQSAYLKEENLLTLLSQNNFIIPEIQREYVWGNNEKVITKFLKELKQKIGEGCECCHTPDSNNRINIGFLYSYKPNYVKVQNDRFLDENLIDGQQRFTTLFLLLFYFALKENRKDEFLSLIRFDGWNSSFDFKVRDLTKRFLSDLLKNIDTIEDLFEIKDMSWFLKDYKSDLSVKAMIKSLGYIEDVYDTKTKFFNHFLNNIVFWHFKTEVTSEGEELYITMNARGEELADNEITKAAMMLDGIDIVKSGQKWEEWQHLFWKNRNRKNAIQSADFGFNSFLKCIAGLEDYLQVQGKEFSSKEINEILDPDKIESYIKYFQNLLDVSNFIKKHYKYFDWFDLFIDEIWKILNKKDTDWLANYKDQNRGAEQNRMVLFWSWLLFFKEMDKSPKELKELDTIRFLRFFWVRYNNYNRAVVTLKQTVDLIAINGVFDSMDLEFSNSEDESETNEKETYRTNNENLKHKFLSLLSVDHNEDLLEIEELIWKIEDHPINIVGADLRNINSSHLIEFSDCPTLTELTLIKEKFYELFPLKNDESIDYSSANKLRNILFWYGSYWQKKWASYYWKYDFGEWRRIIRDIDSDNEIFESFFNDFKNTESIDKMIENKNKSFDIDFVTEDELSIFKWYSIQLFEDMWKQGRFIAIGHYHHPNPDVNFSNFQELVNIKGNFNGGSPGILSKLIEN